ncbi:MAG: DUF4236 domain-containing protein [Candidatus Binataceae bacterium]
MGSFRFYRRVHVFPGLTVNVSKSGPSLSVGGVHADHKLSEGSAWLGQR